MAPLHKSGRPRCNACVEHKAACFRELPACRACVKNERECVYDIEDDDESITQPQGPTSLSLSRTPSQAGLPDPGSPAGIRRSRSIPTSIGFPSSSLTNPPPDSPTRSARTSMPRKRQEMSPDAEDILEREQRVQRLKQLWDSEVYELNELKKGARRRQSVSPIDLTGDRGRGPKESELGTTSRQEKGKHPPLSRISPTCFGDHLYVSTLFSPPPLSPPQITLTIRPHSRSARHPFGVFIFTQIPLAIPYAR